MNLFIMMTLLATYARALNQLKKIMVKKFMLAHSC
jgi:hypothetical protein